MLISAPDAQRTAGRAVSLAPRVASAFLSPRRCVPVGLNGPLIGPFQTRSHCPAAPAGH